MTTIRERGLWAALAFAIVARIALGIFGGRTFDASWPWWHLLDSKLLREEPLTSLYYLHMQPPLYNGLFALSLALPGELGKIFLNAVYVGLSLTMVAIVYFFLRRWRFSMTAAAVLAALFSVLPQILLFENVFLYAHLETVLVMAAMYFAAVYTSRRTLSAFVGFAASLAALALVRALFHIGWVVVALAVIWGVANLRRPRDLRALGVAVVCLIVVGSVYAKNYREFGIFSASSWQGINTSLMTLPLNPWDKENAPNLVEDLRSRIDRGEFSPSARVALAGPNAWWAWNPAAKGCEDADTPRVLCTPKRSDGDTNFNHLAIIRYSSELGGDTLRGLRLYPMLFARHVASSLLTFFGTPSWDFFMLDPASERYRSLWNAVLLYEPGRIFAGGKLPDGGWARLISRIRSASLPLCLLVLVTIAIVLMKGGRELVAALRGRGGGRDWIFPALVVAVVLVVPNIVNGVEANRMRYTIEPILYLALAAGAREALAFVRR